MINLFQAVIFITFLIVWIWVGAPLWAALIGATLNLSLTHIVTLLSQILTRMK